MTLQPCAVAGCPVLVMQNVAGTVRCQLHEQAALAEHLGAVERPCVGCERLIRKGEYVLRRRQARAKTRRVRPGEDRYGWKHLACAPKKPKLSRRARREAVKPLLEGL